MFFCCRATIHHHLDRVTLHILDSQLVAILRSSLVPILRNSKVDTRHSNLVAILHNNKVVTHHSSHTATQLVALALLALHKGTRLWLVMGKVPIHRYAFSVGLLSHLQQERLYLAD